MFGRLRFIVCTALLAAVGVSAHVAAQPRTPFGLQAENITYEASPSRIMATGNPVVVSGTEGVLNAPRVSYLIEADRLLAEGGVTFTDPSGTTLQVEKLELSGDLKAGVLERMRLALPNLGEVGTASAGSVSGSSFTLQNITYSPCKTCEGDRKPWEIKAKEAVFNQASGTMTYRGAQLDVYGVPVAYVPWFRHPLGTEDPQSGLLPPGYGRSQTLGEEIYLGGYVWSPRENADYTLKTRLMSARGAQIIGERRQVGTQGKSELRGSFLNDTGLPPGEGKLRSHLNAIADYNLSESRRIGINAEVASDDTYLNQFFGRNDPYLTSTVFAEDGGPQQYVGASLVHYQDLNPSARPATTAQVLPHLQASRWWALGSQGAQLSLDGDLLALQRGLGTDTRRIATRAAYTLPAQLADGSRLTFAATTRADIYTISGAKNGAVTRILPEATLTWDKPYLSPSGYHQIGPKVMAAFSPRGGNFNDKIPNEDSVAYELDTANLFEPSRFAGLDRIETGPRLIYGLDNRWGSADKTDYRFFFGQSLRRFDDATLPQTGGASTNVSDWVGEAEAAPTDYFSANSRFRLDNTTFVVRRMDAGMQLGRTEGMNISAVYSFLDNGPENIAAQAAVPISDDWRFAARTRHDLEGSTLLEAEGALTWLRDCYAIEFIARRRGFRSTNLQPSTDYLVNVQLLTLGRDALAR